MAGGGWLKLHRNRGEALALLLRHPHALALLTLLATRARYKAGKDPGSGIELQVGEALTGRGDAALIDATPKQYRVCKDQLIRWGFVVTSRATKGATWGTVLKITDTAIYEIVPSVQGHVEGRLGATWGPTEGHEIKPLDHLQITTAPGGVIDEGTDKIKEYVRLAACCGKVKNPSGLERYLQKNGGLTDSHLAQLANWKQGDALPAEKRQKLEDYKIILAGQNDFLASKYAWPGEEWADFRRRISGELTRLLQAN